jgi:MFS family permease
MEGQNSSSEIETDSKLQTGTGYQFPPGSVGTNPEETAESPSRQVDVVTYSNFPLWRKNTILFIVSWMTLAATFSSTSLFPAVPEIALEFSTTTEVINISNAGVIIAMGSSSLVWGPISGIIGRRHAYNAAILVLCICSVGAAAAPDFRTFTSMRVLGGFTGTFFMIAGQTILADIFEPVRSSSSLKFSLAHRLWEYSLTLVLPNRKSVVQLLASLWLGQLAGQR